MTYFLRVIRQARWFKNPDLEWLPAGELQGDALGDLQTTGNALSVFRVESEADKELVVIALAANRERLDVLDYAIFEDSKFTSLGIAAEQREGTTPDMEANKLHYHLQNLTVGRLAQLAQLVSAGNHDRIPRKLVKSQLQQAIRAGILKRERLKPQLLGDL